MRTPLRDSLIGPRLQGEPAWLRYGLAVGLFACTAFARIELIPLIGRHSPLLAFVLPVVARLLPVRPRARLADRPGEPGPLYGAVPG